MFLAQITRFRRRFPNRRILQDYWRKGFSRKQENKRFSVEIMLNIIQITKKNEGKKYFWSKKKLNITLQSFTQNAK